MVRPPIPRRGRTVRVNPSTRSTTTGSPLVSTRSCSITEARARHKAPSTNTCPLRTSPSRPTSAREPLRNGVRRTARPLLVTNQTYAAPIAVTQSAAGTIRSGPAPAPATESTTPTTSASTPALPRTPKPATCASAGTVKGAPGIEAGPRVLRASPRHQPIWPPAPSSADIASRAGAGQGGMGVVYRATQLGLDRSVALKVIAAELRDNPDFRERFKSEAQLAASIDHPNVVPIFEAGEADGVLYLAMRYVEGTDLRALVDADGRPGARARRAASSGRSRRARRRAPPRARAPRRQAAQRPDRATATEDHAYLTDFGLTKHARRRGRHHAHGQFVGTPDFVAPEQIRGERADARADVYALGAVLFHALTGRVPFPRDSELAKMYAHLSDPPPAASRARAGRPGRARRRDRRRRWRRTPPTATRRPATWRARPGPRSRATLAPAPAGSVATGEARRRSASRVPDTPRRRARRRPRRWRRAASAAAAGAPRPAGAASPPAPPAGRGAGAWRCCVALPRRSWSPARSPRSAAAGRASAATARRAGDASRPRARRRGDRDRRRRSPAATPKVGGDDPGRGRARRRRRRRRRRVRLARRDGTLGRIDARHATRSSASPCRSGANPDQIAAGKGVVWVVDAEGDEPPAPREPTRRSSTAPRPGRQGRRRASRSACSSSGSPTPATTRCSASTAPRPRPSATRSASATTPTRHLRRLEGLGDELPRRHADADRHRHRAGRRASRCPSATARAA